jgi:UDP-N-acetylmuramoyl-L-alanyl-D-glutamate--2,6-diaminopimelate ligase
MKLLTDILYKVRIEEVVGSTHVAISNISFDSREVEKFGLFIAISGTQNDGHKYIAQVIEKGCNTIVCEVLPAEINDKITYVKVKNSQAALAVMAANYYNHPSRKLKLIGITGTNGKTTSATLLYKLFSALGYKTGLISTVKNVIVNTEIVATHTTPDSLSLNKLLQEMLDAGVTHCFMEVSSHAVVQHRIDEITFAGAAFTNITHDHLDYHVTFENYLAAKKGFFDMLPNTAFALSNKDDRNGTVILQNTKAKKQFYALQQMADFKCRIIESSFSGLMLSLNNTEVWLKLIGSFNAYNITMVYAIATLLGENKTNILTTLSTLNSVDGRFQFVKSDNGVIGIVDYAHTPDALENVLNTINDIRTNNEQLITIVGCGGNRDALKRPIMAKIACQKSNKIILTSDNPRNENPEEILSQMQVGVEAQYTSKVLSIVDRKQAIKTACMLAKKGDIILVAGKGHEKYQEINGVKNHFDDVEELANAFDST